MEIYRDGRPRAYSLLDMTASGRMEPDSEDSQCAPLFHVKRFNNRPLRPKKISSFKPALGGTLTHEDWWLSMCLAKLPCPEEELNSGSLSSSYDKKKGALDLSARLPPNSLASNVQWSSHCRLMPPRAHVKW